MTDYGILAPAWAATGSADLVDDNALLTAMLANNAFAMRSYRLTAIDGGHYLVVLMIMGAIIAAMGVK